MSATSPVRYPDTRSREAMTRRGWWLVVLNFLIPGSAQVLAGSRRLGRFGLSATIGLWVIAAVTLALWNFARTVVLTLATNSFALTAVQLMLAFYAILWVVLTLDTLRLARLVKIAPAARTLVAGFAAITLVVGAGAAGWGVTAAQSARELISEVFSYGDVEEPVDGRYNILLLGGDAGPDRLGLRPDSISVVSIDAQSGIASIIGVPRNLEKVGFSEGSPLWKPFPNGYDCGDDCLVSYLYTYGQEHPEMYPAAVSNGSDPGVEAMRDATEGLTGLTLQYFVLIDMQGFSNLIDALGGIEVDVPDAVDVGENGGKVIFTIPAGIQRMNGETALWYSRSRYNMTDFDRMIRQRQVQEAIIAQADPSNVLLRFQDVAAAGAQVVKTDIPQSMLAYFVDLAAKTRSQPVGTVELVPDSGVDPAYPDFGLVSSLIAAEFSRVAALSTSPPTP
ncbi:MAG: LCP family protein [Microbacteriaceae bacterium]